MTESNNTSGRGQNDSGSANRNNNKNNGKGKGSNCNKSQNSSDLKGETPELGNNVFFLGDARQADKFIETKEAANPPAKTTTEEEVLFALKQLRKKKKKTTKTKKKKTAKATLSSNPSIRHMLRTLEGHEQAHKLKMAGFLLKTTRLFRLMKPTIYRKRPILFLTLKITSFYPV